MASMDLKAAHDELQASLAEIDVTLDSLGDSASFGKRKITNELIENNKKSWEPVVEALVGQLNDANDETQIGVYFGIVRALQNEFSAKLTEKVATIVASQPEAVKPDLSEEQVTAMSKARSEIYSKLKTLIDLAKSFGADDGMYPPKKRTGGRGKRGPRAISFFAWNIEGKDYDGLKEVAADYDQYEKTSELTAAMRESGLNLKEPEDRIEFTMPDGKLLVGTRSVEDTEDDGIDDDDDEEDNSED